VESGLACCRLGASLTCKSFPVYPAQYAHTHIHTYTHTKMHTHTIQCTTQSSPFALVFYPQRYFTCVIKEGPSLPCCCLSSSSFFTLSVPSSHSQPSQTPSMHRLFLDAQASTHTHIHAHIHRLVAAKSLPMALPKGRRASSTPSKSQRLL